METQIETWKPVVGYEGIYEVSSFGNIKSLLKIRKGASYIKKCGNTPQGYLNIILSINKRPKTFLVHRLVAIAFLPNPKNKRCVNHKNGIKSDNRLINLEWVTHSENNIHAFNIGLRVQRGEKHHRAKITELDVLKIRELYSTGAANSNEIAMLYNIGSRMALYIINRHSWKHI
jgi:hypothetical protein